VRPPTARQRVALGTHDHVVMAMTGHSEKKMAHHYDKVSDARKSSAVDAFVGTLKSLRAVTSGVTQG